MVISMHGLEIRDGIWKYRRAIPAQLRPAFGGAYNIIRSLGTRDRAVALRPLRCGEDGSRSTRYGSVTAQWSKWWGRHARRLGIGDKRKTFHSFRPLFKDAAREVMPEEHHDALSGHSNQSVGRTYGRGVPLKVLAQSMARVSFSIEIL